MRLKVLTIGNSFSICLGKNLPQIVKAGKKHQLELTSAYIGGCPLQLHAEHLEAAEKDPSFSPYVINVWDSCDARKKTRYTGNVLTLLQRERYDIITLQQASCFSWDPATYEPWAETVISYIKKYNPAAEIMVQETWSYRSDSHHFAEIGGDWGFDSEGMYTRLKEAYSSFAQKRGFALIPVGDAIQLYRKKSKRIYKVLSPEKLSKFRAPDLPPVADDVVGCFGWRKNEEGEMILIRDSNHLNTRGEYLQACVWYGKLFKEDPEGICYERRDISRSETLLMRKCAKAVLK